MNSCSLRLNAPRGRSQISSPHLSDESWQDYLFTPVVFYHEEHSVWPSCFQEEHLPSAGSEFVGFSEEEMEQISVCFVLISDGLSCVWMIRNYLSGPVIFLSGELLWSDIFSCSRGAKSNAFAVHLTSLLGLMCLSLEMNKPGVFGLTWSNILWFKQTECCSKWSTLIL